MTQAPARRAWPRAAAVGGLAGAGLGEGFAEARRRADEPGGPAILKDNPILKLIGVAEDPEVVAELNRVMENRASRLVNLVPMRFQQDRDLLYREIAGSSVALMLSWHEGFGLTGWEAIAGEVPLIVSEQSGLRRFLYEESVSRLAYEVNIDGSLGGDTNQNFSDRDLKNVADRILEVASDSMGAAGRAALIKDIWNQSFGCCRNTRRKGTF